MACAARTYTVKTSSTHTPTWNGKLTVDADGNGLFQPEGSSSSQKVTVECGTKDGTHPAWISFRHDKVHYRKAAEVDNSKPIRFKGDADDDTTLDSDTWTAEAQGLMP